MFFYSLTASNERFFSRPGMTKIDADCGSIAALRRSKKRVRDVISTELPFLLSKEFPSNQENSICAAKYSASDYSIRRAAELHESYWSKLFNQMDNTLSEEEKELVSYIQ